MLLTTYDQVENRPQSANKDNNQCPHNFTAIHPFRLSPNKINQRKCYEQKFKGSQRYQAQPLFDSSGQQWAFQVSLIAQRAAGSAGLCYTAV